MYWLPSSSQRTTLACKWRKTSTATRSGAKLGPAEVGWRQPSNSQCLLPSSRQKIARRESETTYQMGTIHSHRRMRLAAAELFGLVFTVSFSSSPFLFTLSPSSTLLSFTFLFRPLPVTTALFGPTFPINMSRPSLNHLDD